MIELSRVRDESKFQTRVTLVYDDRDLADMSMADHAQFYAALATLARIAGVE